LDARFYSLFGLRASGINCAFSERRPGLSYVTNAALSGCAMAETFVRVGMSSLAFALSQSLQLLCSCKADTVSFASRPERTGRDSGPSDSLLAPKVAAAVCDSLNS